MQQHQRGHLVVLEITRVFHQLVHHVNWREWLASLVENEGFLEVVLHDVVENEKDFWL